MNQIEKSNYKKVRGVLILTLLLNIIVATTKIIVGFLINSSAIIADGFHSISDGSSNIVGLVGISLAAKPVDEDHPYGHHKFETMSGVFIAVMLTFISIEIIRKAIVSFQNPVEPSVTTTSIVLLCITLCVNIFVSEFERRQGKKLGSMILTADSAHTRSDIFITIGVIISLVAMKLGAPPIIDPIVSLIVACFIIHAAITIFKNTNDILTDKVAVDEKTVEEVVLSFGEIQRVHKIRSRGSSNQIFIDLHIKVKPEMPVIRSHELSHEVADKMQETFGPHTQCIIHVEPEIQK